MNNLFVQPYELNINISTFSQVKKLRHGVLWLIQAHTVSEWRSNGLLHDNPWHWPGTPAYFCILLFLLSHPPCSRPPAIQASFSFFPGPYSSPPGAFPTAVTFLIFPSSLVPASYSFSPAFSDQPRPAQFPSILFSFYLHNHQSFIYVILLLMITMPTKLKISWGMVSQYIRCMLHGPWESFSKCLLF